MGKLLTPEKRTVGRYLDPTNDLAFKKVFGTVEYKPSLISFLNAILSLVDNKRIENIEFLTKEQIPLRADGKFAVLDVRCTDREGNQYIIEMQSKAERHFVKRCQYYASHSYVSQGFSGMEFSSLRPVIFLAIVDHILFPEDEHVISCHHILDVKTNKHKLKDLRYYFIELPKFTKNADELETIQEQWVYYFKNWKNALKIPSNIQDEALIEAYRAIERFNWSREELDEYVKTNLARTSYELDLEAKWEKGLKKGHEKGHEEGLKKGHEKGHEEGLKKGHEAGLEEGKLAIAGKLLKLGTPLEDVLKATGLRADQL